MGEQVINGADYIARTRVSDSADRTVAAEGETCEHIDPSSLPWLIEQGYIVRAEHTAQGDADVDA
jgi:hypothetical protein